MNKIMGVAQIHKAALVIFFILYSLFSIPSTARAQEEPPTTSPDDIGTSTGSQFEAQWNYFRVVAPNCTLKNIFNELQADGGGALTVNEVWSMKNNVWGKYTFEDPKVETVQVDSETIFAFNSNQKFYFDMASDVCTKEDLEREEQIAEVREVSTGQGGQSFLEKIASVPGEFWNNLLGTLGFGKQENALPEPKYSAETALFDELNVLGQSIVADLGVTGKLTIGTLWMDGLEGSINNLGALQIQDKVGGPVEFMNGVASIDQNGNLRLEGGLILDSQGERPTCNMQSRGKIWFTKKQTGDLVEICIRDSSGNFRWKEL